MDFHGQKLAEDAYQVIILAFSVISFIAGYSQSSFPLMMKIFGAGVLVSLLLTVPPWPFLNRHPLPWLKKPVEAAEGQVVAAVAKEPVAKQGGGKQGGSKRRK